jgi:GNAT superfamily N-acetyltransferase
MKPQITIRQASKEDIALIRDLAQIIFPHTYGKMLSQEQVDYMMDWMYSPENLASGLDSGQEYFIVEEEGEAVSYAGISPQAYDPDGTKVFELMRLYILPEHQKTGLGKLLFKHVCDHIRSKGFKKCRMMLHVNRENPAVRFYLHQGMRILYSKDFDIGNNFRMNDHIMGMDL